jgi:hypothetical protein
MRWPDKDERRPSGHQGGDQMHNTGDGIRDIVPVAPVIPLVTAAQIEAWLAAVAYLHERGLPAAVPQEVADRLQRRGVRPDWTTRGAA